MISPHGSVHIPVMDLYEGITDEQIIEITISCGISLGSWRGGVADSLTKMDQDRAVECSVVEAT